MKSKIEKIVNLLAKEELTSKEITEKLDDITPDIACVYLNKLLKNGTIERTNNKKPYKYKKSMTLKEILKQVLDFMSNKCEVVEEVIDSEIQLLEIAKERVK